MRGSPRSIAFLWVLAGALISACGYHSTLAPVRRASASEERDPAAPERARVSVSALRSHSPEPWLDRIVTDALRRELAGRARLRLIDDPDAAQLRIHGRIRPIDITSRSFSSFVAALEYSLTLALDLEVRLANGSVVRLDPQMLSETDSYLASPDIEITRTNRLEALRRISDLLAVRVADALEMMEHPIGRPEEVPDERAGG